MISERCSSRDNQRNNLLIDQALNEGEGHREWYRQSVPGRYAVRCAGSVGARLFQPDTRLLRCTKDNYLLLSNANPAGEGPKQICSVRLSSGRAADALSFNSVTNTSIRAWLGAHSVLTTDEYNQTPDDITGIVYESSNTSTPTNVEGITKPLLIVVMGAHYFTRRDELFLPTQRERTTRPWWRLRRDAWFTPGANCPGAPFGDTVKRLFDFVDVWLTEPGRF